MEKKCFGEYAALVEEAGKFHGDICHGIAIGTRMTMSGLARIGISDPKGSDRKKLLVFVEIDRCTTDAIMALTGCRPGKRSMKLRDYGKMAATFINIETGKAARVAVRSRKDKKDGGAPPHPSSEKPDYAAIPEDELFTIREVAVNLRPEDMPGKPLRRVSCERCGESVMDGREVAVDGSVFCRPCYDAADYYAHLPA